jgi:ankyrin repeat protein
MKIRSFLNRLSSSRIPRLTIISLIALACSKPAFCGEIHDAANAGDLEKVKALLKKDPDLVSSRVNERDISGFTPLHWAAMAGKKDIAELLLANGAKVNAKIDGRFGGCTPLHLAAWTGHKDVAELLLADKAEVDAKDNWGRTPLHKALDLFCNKDIAELLLAHAEPRSTPWIGWGGRLCTRRHLSATRM